MKVLPRRKIVEGAVRIPVDRARDPDALSHKPESERDPVIVVGGGPSGLRAAQEVLRRGHSVILFNAERWRPYNRLKLTPFFAGEIQIGRVYQEGVFSDDSPIIQYRGQTIVRIDRAEKTVQNQFGRRFRYSKLILCLGSHPHIPPIPGFKLDGVLRFRNFDDVEILIARSMRSRCTAIIGGGLLGLEAARGLLMRGVRTVLVEHEPHLMPRQLDRAGGQLLCDAVTRLGLQVRTGCAVRGLEGHWRVERIVLSNGEIIPCDSVVMCTGIRANIDVARNAGLTVGHGIVVSDTMQTTDPHIYSAGECAEHDGHIYGLVAPGLEQAAIAAAHIAGEKASYKGSSPTTKLKVVGTDVFSMGDVEQLDQRTDVRTIVWSDTEKDLYRRLVVRRNRIVGALAVGEWPELGRMQQAVRDRTLLMPWDSLRFKRSGTLFKTAPTTSVTLWPDAATVCNCTGVTRGQLGGAIGGGACTLDTLMRETSASTVCGSCRPLLQELLGAPAKHDPVFGSRAIAAGSVLALLAGCAALLLPAWPYSPSVEAGIGVDALWLDGTVKQITGFTLLTLSALIAFLSIRKRFNLKWIGSYRFWRVAHVLIGTAALAALFAHTGFNLGNNLNRWLMTAFLAVAVIGSATGIVTAREHVVLARGGHSLRAALTWLHIIAFWPLPVLLLLHIVTVYAY